MPGDDVQGELTMGRRKPTRMELRRLKEGGEPIPTGPFYPEPGDYIRAISRLLQDGRTKSEEGVLIQDVGCWSLICWDLPRRYRPRPDDEDAEYPGMTVVLRIKVTDEFELAVGLHSVADQERDLAIEDKEEDDSVDEAEVKVHARYVREAFGCSDDEVVLSGVDVRDADSAVRLKDALARFGIDLYCPVRSLREALESTP
jgi:hypothetical protein